MQHLAKTFLAFVSLIAGTGVASAQSSDSQEYTVQQNRFEIKVSGIDDILECRVGNTIVLHISNGTADATINGVLKKGKNELSCEVTDNNPPYDRVASYEYEVLSGGTSLGGVRKGVCYGGQCKTDNPVYSTKIILNFDVP